MAMTETLQSAKKKPNRSRLYIVLAVVAVLGAIALDTKVVQIGSVNDVRQEVFNPDLFGREQFPRIRDIVLSRAPEASVFASELAADKKAAIEKYATMVGGFPTVPVQLTGIAGDEKSGVFDIAVAGLPEGTTVRVQTGPAINGTELRDISGDIEFGAFKNQIEYQDAGSGINRAMSAEVLSDLDRTALSGKTVSVTGVFKLINAKNWLITPVRFEVQ